MRVKCAECGRVTGDWFEVRDGVLFCKRCYVEMRRQAGTYRTTEVRAGEA